MVLSRKFESGPALRRPSFYASLFVASTRLIVVAWAHD